MEFSPPTGIESMQDLCTGWRRKLHPAAIRQTNRKSEMPFLNAVEWTFSVVSRSIIADLVSPTGEKWEAM